MITPKMLATIKALDDAGGTDSEMARPPSGEGWLYHRGTVRALVRRGLIEYVDPQEIRIALTPKARRYLGGAS